VKPLQEIGLRPLELRSGELPGLLDHLLAERLAGCRFADLAPANRDALCSHGWRGNFIALRLAADRLAAIARVPGWEAMSWPERSAAVGISKTTIFEWFKGLGLTSPLFAP
jgi:DNA-binding NtrC family response regulator